MHEPRVSVFYIFSRVLKFPECDNTLHCLEFKTSPFFFSLVKAAKIKGCSELKEWIEPIVNHFWFCSQTSEGSEEKIKVRMMFGP